MWYPDRKWSDRRRRRWARSRTPIGARTEPRTVLEPSDDERPEEQFDAVTRYEEPAESTTEGDSETLGPPIPEPPDPESVDPSIRVSFWRLVLLFNAALLLTSVGVMFVVFQGELVLGGQLSLVGLGLFGYGFFRYRRATAELGDGGTGDSDPSDEDG